MRLSKELEENVKEEIWEYLNKKFGQDISINAKEIKLGIATVTIELLLDIEE